MDPKKILTFVAVGVGALVAAEFAEELAPPGASDTRRDLYKYAGAAGGAWLAFVAMQKAV